MRATNDVENSISKRAMSPSFVSKHFEKGSVVYIRKPLEVPKEQVSDLGCVLGKCKARTYCQVAVVLIESYEVHRHGEATRGIGAVENSFGMPGLLRGVLVMYLYQIFFS